MYFNFSLNGSRLLKPVIYCCLWSFCSSSSGKIVIAEVLVITAEVLVQGGVRSRTRSESEDSKKVESKIADKGLLQYF